MEQMRTDMWSSNNWCITIWSAPMLTLTTNICFLGAGLLDATVWFITLDEPVVQ